MVNLHSKRKFSCFMVTSAENHSVIDGQDLLNNRPSSSKLAPTTKKKSTAKKIGKVIVISSEVTL